MAPTPKTSASAGRRGPLRRLLDLSSSIWLGVTLLTLLFIYSSIGSAGLVYYTAQGLTNNQLRQWRGLEMTEFEWFHWWPFDLLITLICINIIVATLRRIPFRPVNYGVWMIHSGILLLALGSVIYFTTKVEGDTPVFRRQVVIEVPGYETVTMPAVPGNRQVAGSGPDGYMLEVWSIDPQWELLSGEDKGKRAFSVTVRVKSARDEFMRQLVAGYPQYTEDLIFQSGGDGPPVARAAKVLGHRLVDDKLELSLDHLPAEYVYLSNAIRKSWAIYLREVGSEQWHMRAVSGLPLYNDYIEAESDVWLAPGEPLQLDPLAVEVPAAMPDDPLPGTDLFITSYLRFAHFDSRRRPGGERVDPAITVRLQDDQGHGRDYEMIALDPDENTVEGGRLGFRYADSPEQRRALLTRREPLLRVEVPGGSVSLDVPLEQTLRSDPQLQWTELTGTEYAFRVSAVDEALVVRDRRYAVAIVEVRKGAEVFTRWVFDEPKLVRDLAMNDSGVDLDALRPLDPNIVMTYRPRTGPPAPVSIIAGPKPDEVGVLISLAEADPRYEPLALNQPVDIDSGVSLSMIRYLPNTFQETRPRVVPPAQRNKDVKELNAKVKVSVGAPGAADARTVWVPYHFYPFPGPNFNLRRYPYAPAVVDLPDGRRIELILSRQRRKLPAPVILDDFTMVTHPGGFSGDNVSILNWTSHVRFAEAEVWSALREVSVNDPIEDRGYWYFQAQWDPPTGPRGPDDRPSAGNNFTVLGVGNRRGVGIQLLGCIVAVIGMIYAFYVKPLIKRRQRQRVHAQVAERETRGREPVAAAALPLISAGEGKIVKQATVLLLTLLCVASANAAAPADSTGPTLPEMVDTAALAGIAVYADGRVKSFESFATSMMRMVHGARPIDDQRPTYTYLDMMLRPQRYADRPVVYVKKQPMRAQIVAALGRSQSPPPDFERWTVRFMDEGLITERLLTTPAVLELIETWRRDLVLTAKFANQLESALTIKDPRFLKNRWAVVPPVPAEPEGRWRSVRELLEDGAQSSGGELAHPAVVEAWIELDRAWTAQDAPGSTSEAQAEQINAAIGRFAAELAAINPSVYPDRGRLHWESFYFRSYNLTWIWVIYAFSIVPLLLSIIFRWPAARWVGLAIFLVAFAMHTFALGLRWYVADRWPNSNMFEAVTTSVWFGAVAAIVLELLVRKRLMRGLFALGSAVASMVALMCAYYMPLSLDAGITNRMPVLHDVWLYIHTNVIIFSYCLIFMAAVSALIYLVYRLLGRWRGFAGPGDYAKVGGAGSLILPNQSGGATARESASLGQVLDGTTMVLMELSFIMLWTGLVMGAIWADHSWGRPWGWDPKEVFALNTFIVFLVLVHGRLKVKDKGLWTAAIAMVGAAVMLFNWIAINFVITGLHSYA